MRENELDVLSQYDIDINSTRRVRGAILCDTNQGPMLLKEMSFSERKLAALFELQEYLEEQGYKRTDKIIKTIDQEFVSTSESDTKYLLKKWYYGKECDCKQEQDILQGVKNLAVIHQFMTCPGTEQTYPRKESLKEEFFRHNRELKKVRTFMRERVAKGEFELIYLKYFAEIYEWAVFAQNRLEKSNYLELLESSKENGKIAHGDYNYHNILMTSEGIVTTNFEHFYEGIQITDFYYYLRKIMEKNQWNISLGHKMLEQYNQIHTFTDSELEYIAICIAYPEKFWKIANSYYRSSKAWVSIKSIEKLEMAIKQTKEKQKFLEILFSFRI